MTRATDTGPRPGIPKATTGIAGFDEVTRGGLPAGRPTLVCGGAGCGKTLFSVEFLVRGAVDFDEPGVFISFEEREQDIIANVSSLGFDLGRLVDEGRLYIDHILLDPNEFVEAGEYDLEGLFLRIGLAIDAVGAKRIVLDTIESLFGTFTNQGILRAELVRLFNWLKDRGVTAVITGERGEGTLTRWGLEEYVSDCVILLDHRVVDEISTRRLRIVKYRGSAHGTNEYPFLIDEEGFAVLPITSAALQHRVYSERVPSGVADLDDMLGGQGFYRGSSVLVSGTAGTGKSLLSAHFVDATCRRGERALVLAFEESPAQQIRNARSVGLDLQRWVDEGLIEYSAVRPTMYGLEMHLVQAQRLIDRFQPSVVVVDPASALLRSDNEYGVSTVLLRLLDFLKARGITAFFVSLTHGGDAREATLLQVSSLVDTWLLLRHIELGGELNRGLYVLKSRGMRHSNQIREFLITNHGIQLQRVYVGPSGVLTGTARITREAEEAAAARRREDEASRLERELERRRTAFEARQAVLLAEFGAEEETLRRQIDEARQREVEIMALRDRLGSMRGADSTRGGD